MRKLIVAKLLLLLSGVGMVTACSQKEHPYTFYYWRTTLQLNDAEKAALQKATSPYLYVRFFDIEKKDGKFRPVATFIKGKNFQTDKEIVPVIFIRNEVFYDIRKDEIDFLAQNVAALTRKKGAEAVGRLSSEIQIDCDWTAGTNREYFAFLEKLKEITGADITCTLRLHQVKNSALSGMPPVDKVYLMCYSTSSPLEESTRNSILDVTTLKNYLKNVHRYPLDITVALPIYSWGVITNHTGKHKLLNALSAADLSHPKLQKISATEAVVLEDGFYFGTFLSKGFKIKVEEISPQQLSDTKNFLEQNLSAFDIVYYHLDSRFLKNQTF